jgi:hypothetical protein
MPQRMAFRDWHPREVAWGQNVVSLLRAFEENVAQQQQLIAASDIPPVLRSPTHAAALLEANHVPQEDLSVNRARTRQYYIEDPIEGAKRFEAPLSRFAQPEDAMLMHTHELTAYARNSSISTSTLQTRKLDAKQRSTLSELRSASYTPNTQTGICDGDVD